MLLVSLFILSNRVHSAPFPTTGSSLYLNSQKNLYLHPFGFELNLEKTDASINLQANDSEKWVIHFPDNKQVFTMRYRVFTSAAEYEKSLRIWLREYQKSGLRIVQESVQSKRPNKGWIHLEDTSGRQIFQYFSYHNLYWVYFGCAGSKDALEQIRRRCDLLNSRISIGDQILNNPKKSTIKAQ